MWPKLKILLNGTPSGSGPVRPVARLIKSMAALLLLLLLMRVVS
jgi:hypothetical protein